MFRKSTFFLIGLTLAVSNTSAQEQLSLNILKVDPSSTKLQSLSNFEGVSNGFLVGSFGEAGLYTAVGEMEAGSNFPAHTHPDMRLTYVVSGTMFLGEGQEADPDKLVAYPAGTLAITPAGTPHFMAALDGDFRVLEIGAGPSDFAFTEGKTQ